MYQGERAIAALAPMLALLLIFSVAGVLQAGAAESAQVETLDPRVGDSLALLDRWIEQQVAYQQLPGLTIGIVYEGELIWSKGYGVSDLESRAPMTPATPFRIGSVTKLFTATAIMQLRDQGKLCLDDPVSHHLPWFEIESTFEEAPDITIRHLLTHTAGIPREAAFPYWTDHVFPERHEIAAALPGQPALFPPATTYKYSNLGMALLGEVVAEVSGIDYTRIIEENLLRPLGMESSAVVPLAEQVSRLATGYMRRQRDGSREIFEYYEMHGMAPTGNIVSTVEDLARFAALHLRQDVAIVGPAGLRTNTLREMQRPHWVYPSWTGGRGLGFGISRRGDKTIVFHGGWIAGNRCHFLLAPEEKIAVVVMTNADDGSPSDFSYQAYDLVGPALIESTASPAPEKRVDPAWELYFGLYSDPWDWEYEVMILDEELVLYSHSYPPDEDAASGLTRLELIEEHTFRMPDRETVVFELDSEGKVERIRRRYDYLYPVKD